MPGNSCAPHTQVQRVQAVMYIGLYLYYYANIYEIIYNIIIF